MFKLEKRDTTNTKEGRIFMKDMKPLQLARVDIKYYDEDYFGDNIVMRTASKDKFEVIDLSSTNHIHGIRYWTEPCNIPVVPLEPTDTIIVKLFNVEGD